MATSYCVVYRTGGTERFQWHRTVADSRENTDRLLAEVRQAGYHAFMTDYSQSVAIGLPETFE